MDIQPATQHSRYTVVASHYARLNSNVIDGGGDDDTAVLQAILDMAPVWGSLYLILDGAALVSGLQVHSNTTIECLNQSCGFFLKSGSNRSILENAHLSYTQINEENITLIGGTYNHNSQGQEHHVSRQGDPNSEAFEGDKWVIAFEFYGVRNLTMRGLTIRNQRTFSMLIACWENVNMEDIAIDLPDNQYAQNQDGIHFWGPGRFLSMRNIRGTAGDDFIALAPDENDLVSSITDVHIDGVFLNDSDQGIRMLSRGSGRLDRVVVRNVTGTYKSFGFYINSWFPGPGGNYGSITLENIDLRPTQHKYPYCNPLLFRFGGIMESLALRNVRIHNYEPERAAIEVGIPFYEPNDEHTPEVCRIRNLTIDGLEVFEDRENPGNRAYVKVLCPVEALTLRNAQVLRTGMPEGALVELTEQGRVEVLSIAAANLQKLDTVVRSVGQIGNLTANGVIAREVAHLLEGTADAQYADGVHGIEA